MAVFLAGEAGHGSLGLDPLGTVGSELVDVVGGAALAPAAAANPGVPMMPGGHIAPNALRPRRRPVRAAVRGL